MTNAGAASHRSAAGMRDGAIALLAAGNTLEAIAGIYQVSVETLRTLVAQPADAIRTGTTPAVPPPPWAHFPGTVTYRTGNYMAVFGLVALLVFIPMMWYVTFRMPKSPMQWIFGLFLVTAVALLFPLIQVVRAIRIDRFEMRPDAVARYTLKGCTVLPYADMTGYTAQIGKGYYCVHFLARKGAGLTIYPTIAQMQDSDFADWLRTLPERDVVRTRAEIVMWWCMGLLMACVAIAVVISVRHATTHCADDGIATHPGAAQAGSGRCDASKLVQPAQY